MMSTADLVREYCRRGWAPVPVPYRRKAPTVRGWQNLRIGEADIPAYFDGQSMNIGLLLGKPSGWLVDVDLDHEQAVALARDYLPPTGAVFGREGKGASHWLYRMPRPVDTRKWQTSEKLMLVELRSTGCQTIAPGSVHESGELIRWEAKGEPAEVDPDELVAALDRLATSAADLAGLTLKPPKRPRGCVPTEVMASDADRAWRYIAKLPYAVSGQGGHDATFRAACECFRFGLNDAEAWRVLGRFNNEKCFPPWSEAELRHKLEQARDRVATDGETGCRLKAQQTSGASSTVPGQPVRSAGECNAHRFMLTDIGNAARFAHQHRTEARWCGGLRCWLVWTGKRWERDNTERVTGLAKQTALALLDEAKTAVDDQQRERIAHHAASTQRRERLSAMIALARDELAVRADDLDADPWVLNVLNGSLDLRTGNLREHNPATLITKLARVEYQPDAEAPRFTAFLQRIFDGDDELISFMQRWLGHCMTGDTSEQLLPVAHGAGANGKSTLLDTIVWLLGDYAGITTSDLFVESRAGVHEQRYELAELRGKRLVIATESERGRRLRVALIKTLTGDEYIKCRAIYGHPFTYERSFKPILVTNHKPLVNEDTEAIWRRLRLLPFNVLIPKSERDPRLPAKLRAEAAGILRWLVEGCRAWQRDGLGESEAVTAATRQYRTESDPLAGFLRECCTLDSEAWTRTAVLRRAYEGYCKENGETPIGSRTFSDALIGHNCTPDRRNAGRGWRGIRLLDDAAHDGRRSETDVSEL